MAPRDTLHQFRNFLFTGAATARAFAARILPGALALIAGCCWSARLAGEPPKNPEFCAPGYASTPEQQAKMAAALLREPASTQRMAAMVQRIAREADPMLNPFRSFDQVAGLRALEPQTTDPVQLLGLKVQLSIVLLQLGNSEEALKENAAATAIAKSIKVTTDITAFDQLQPDLLTTKAMCYLRMGEQENCLINHNADSCIFPIKDGGVHLLPRGSRGAIDVLSELLGKYPGDLRARWLLNIAYMTLGEYPDKVPAKWLIDPKCFASGYDIKRFPDVAGSLGLDVDDLAGGVVIEDFDGDGFLDIMASSWGIKSQLRLFHNNGDGTFTDRTESALLIGETGALNLVPCDYNNDGHMDVLLLRGAWLATQGAYPCSLLRNNGDFTFTDVTEEAGLLRFHPTNSAVWFDYNNDGWIDLFIANESVNLDPENLNPCELFRNNGDGTFTNVAKECGVDFVGFFKAVVSADYNNDGRPDLFLSRLDGARILLRNDGPAGLDHSPRAPWKFTDVTEAAGTVDPPASFTCWFFDYDNDGWPDLMVNGYRIQDVGDIAADYLGRPHAGQRAKLYHNNGDGTFTDVSRECGVNKLLFTMGGNFGDLDNDGWLDFYVGTGNPDLSTLVPNRMFRNDGGKRFQDVTTSGGFGQLQKGHGIAFGDINNDGDQDIYSVVGGAVEGDHYRNQLFANPGHGNNWLKLQLEGVRTNRAAIGARIKVVVQTDTGERSIYRTVGSGGSFGASPMRQEIGLEQARVIERVEIFWPVTGVTQVVTGLKCNQFYRIREGVAYPTQVELKSFKWPATSVGTKP